MRNSGFTIIESLVAIAILLVAISGAGSAIQTSLSSYIFSKDQIIAFYLAQEGFEQVRNIRDENALNGREWLTGLEAECASACMVAPVINSVATPCSGGAGNCPVLRQDSQTGFYGYDISWPATIFRREITLERVNGNEVSVVVTVDWSKGAVNRQFKARENILNWQ